MSTSATRSTGLAGPSPDISDRGAARQFGNALVLLAIAGFSAIPFVTDLMPLSVALGAVLLAALAMRRLHAVHIGLIATTLAVVMQVPALKVALLPLILTLAVYAAVVLPVPPLRRVIDWFHKGTLDKATWGHIAGIAVISSSALLAWYTLAQPDVSALKAMFSKVPPWGLVLMGLLLPLINATVEEFIFRGVMMSALGTLFGSALTINLIQAASFGLLHKDGFPNGAWGIALAGLYAFLLGLLRQRTRGLLAPWIAHVVADMTIFGIVVGIAR